MRILVTALALVLATGCASSIPRQKAAASFADAELEVRVKSALLNAKEVDATRVDVRAAGGVVTLEGVVASDADARAAVAVARAVPGVVSVGSKLSIARGPAVSARQPRRSTAPS